MARSPGFSYLGIAPQSALGVAAAPIYFYKLRGNMKASPRPKIEDIFDGLSRDPSASAKLSLPYEISFSTYLTTTTGAALLYWAMGSTDTVTGGGDPRTHTGLSRNVLLTPLTVHHSMGDGMDVVEVLDCYIESLTLKSAGESLVTLDVTMKGGQATPGKSADTVTFDSERELEHPDATFTFAGITAAGGDVTDFSLAIKNTLTEVGLPSIYPAFMSGKRDLAVSSSQFVSNNALWRDVFFGGDSSTTEAVHVVFASSIVAKWSPDETPTHQVQIMMNNVAMKDAEPTYDPAGGPFYIKPMGTVTTKSGPAINLVTKNAQAAAFV